MLNKAFLIGRVGQDPEVRQTRNGKSVANLSIATSTRFNGQEQTEWHRVTCWGKTAEIVGEYVRKGKLVFVEGRIQTSKYQDKGGETRYATDIIADRVLFLSNPANSSTTTTEDGAPQEVGGYPAEWDEPGA